MRHKNWRVINITVVFFCVATIATVLAFIFTFVRIAHVGLFSFFLAVGSPNSSKYEAMLKGLSSKIITLGFLFLMLSPFAVILN